MFGYFVKSWFGRGASGDSPASPPSASAASPAVQELQHSAAAAAAALRRHNLSPPDASGHAASDNADAGRADVAEGGAGAVDAAPKTATTRLALVEELEALKLRAADLLHERYDLDQTDPQVAADVVVIHDVLRGILAAMDPPAAPEAAAATTTATRDGAGAAAVGGADAAAASRCEGAAAVARHGSVPRAKPGDELVVYVGLHTEAFDADNFVWTLYVREAAPSANSNEPPSQSSSSAASSSPAHPDAAAGGGVVSPLSPASPFVVAPSSQHRRVQRVRFTVQFPDKQRCFEPADFQVRDACSLNNCCGVLIEIFARPGKGRRAATAGGGGCRAGDAAAAAASENGGGGGDDGADAGDIPLRTFFVTTAIEPGPPSETKHTFFFDDGGGGEGGGGGGAQRATQEPVRPSRRNLARARTSAIKPSFEELRAVLRRHKLSPAILSPHLWVLPNSGVLWNQPSFNQCFWISLNHWFLLCRQHTFSLRELKRTASCDGLLPVPHNMEQTDLVAHHAALQGLARALDLLVRVYIFDRRRRQLVTPADPEAFREELDLGDRALLRDKQRWVVVVHYGNHFELVYRSDQLGYRLDRLHFDSGGGGGDGGRSAFEFADSNKLFWDVDGKKKTAANLCPQMQRQIMQQYLRGEGGPLASSIASAPPRAAGAVPPS